MRGMGETTMSLRICPRCEGEKALWEDDVYFSENPDKGLSDIWFTVYIMDCAYCGGTGYKEVLY